MLGFYHICKTMKRNITFTANLFLIFLLLFAACEQKIKEIPSGKWRAKIHTQAQQIPFIMQIEKNGHWKVSIINGKEVIEIDSVQVRGDSIDIPMHIFDAAIVAKFDNDVLQGYWVKHYVEDYSLPFTATPQQKVFRFEVDEPANFQLEEKYAVKFFNQKDTTEAVGLFEQDENKLSGTFLTNTGDYRFLAGVATGDSLKLSAFNGESAYLFKAKVNENGMVEGEFYSGKSGFKHWVAVPDKDAAMADPDTLTKLKDGFEEFSFALPNLEGDTITDKHPMFDNKVTIVQISGSWCPNCMDETKFLANWYQENNELPVEIVALAFENKSDFEYSRRLLERMKSKYQVTYPILFAGSTDKENVNEKLPMIDRLRAFPSTIFIDKNGKIRKIHTGFSGPGTGKYYDEFVSKFNSFVKKLASE
jgi:thiol-disulfide isomerase/thioredoxin